MTDRDYSNFYTPYENESYQQCPLDNYGQTPEARLEETMIKVMEMQQQLNQEHQQFMEMQQQLNQEHQQYLKNSFTRVKSLEIQLSQIAQHMANTQSMKVHIKICINYVNYVK
jgi:CRISPR/Cas system CMR subunit Cmr6 (Cas7 group RAMP superfamily)